MLILSISSGEESMVTIITKIRALYKIFKKNIYYLFLFYNSCHLNKEKFPTQLQTKL